MSGRWLRAMHALWHARRRSAIHWLRSLRSLRVPARPALAAQLHTLAAVAALLLVTLLFAPSLALTQAPARHQVAGIAQRYSQPARTPTRAAARTPSATVAGPTSQLAPGRQPRHPTATPSATARPRIKPAAVRYSAGDVFVAIGSGLVEHLSAAGTLLETLDTGTASINTTGMCFDAISNLYVTDFQAGTVSKFDSAGNLLQSAWGSGYNYDPESCAIDNGGHVYVGQADGSAEILKFDTAGDLLAVFAPAPEARGTDWIDLAADQCTMYYTSEGTSIHRFNVCTNTQLSDVVTGLVAPCYAMRIRANGELMVACESQVYRLTAAGAVIQTYPTAAYGATDFFAMNLDPDGTSLWTAGLSSTSVYRIDIATGNLLTTIGAGAGAAIGGLAIFGETSATIPNGPQGSERAGNGNPSELNQCVCPHVKPVDGFSGNFSHTFTDLQITGRGPPLLFSRTYNAGAAAQNGPLGFGWTDSYQDALSLDGSGNATIAQENGSTVTFAPDGSGGFTAPSRVLASLVHNGDGTYTFTRAQDQLRFTFSASGQLLRETDRNGYITMLAYDVSGHLQSVTDAGGRALTVTSDGSGRITGIGDPLSRSVAFSYDGAGDLATATDVSGGIWQFTYDTSHLLLTMTDPRGGVTTNVYDGSGRVTSQSDALHRATSFAYSATDASGNSSTTITDPNGNVTIEDYTHGVLVTQTRGAGTPQAATWSYAYDAVTLGLVAVADPNGNITSQTWDANGNLLTTTDPLGRTTTYTYNRFNEVLTATDPLGVTTTNTYDANGNLLSTARPLTGTSQVQTTTYTYGDGAHPGDRTAMTDPDGRTWTYSYDTNGDRIQVTDPLGEITTWQFNMLGWPTAQTRPNGHRPGADPAAYTTHTTYNAFGDALTITDALGGVVTNQYDANRNLTQITDADGHVTHTTFDLDDEPTQVLRADGSTHATGYDGDGNVTSQTDGLNHTTQYSYDALNHLTTVSDPLTRATHFAYDAVGNLLTLTNAAGQVISSAYDGANELIATSYSDGATPSVSYLYDADGQRVRMADGTGTTISAYDSLNRLVSVTDGSGATVSYAYDLAGQLTTLTYPGGQAAQRTFDGDGRLATVRDWLGQVFSFQYDADGNLVQIGYPNQIVSTRIYDTLDRLSTISDVLLPARPPLQPAATPTAAARPTGTPVLAPRATAAPTSAPGPLPLLTFSYTRDAQGLVTSAQPLRPGEPLDAREAYGYTALNQVAAQNGTAFAYDKGDNLTTRGGATLSYDPANELTALAQPGGSTTFSYDARGDRTAAAGALAATYTYDQANRLTSYAASGVSATYTYNGDGLRQAKVVNGGAPQVFAWDTAEGLPLLLRAGALQFVYGPAGQVLEQISGTTALCLLADQLGSIRGLADSSGALVGATAYDAYGAPNGRSGSATSPFGFAGQFTDAESGLLYLRARYYDPATAQFLTRDPIEAISLQAYQYANDNPVAFGDPSGQLFGVDTLLGGAIGAVVGGAWGAGGYLFSVATGDQSWSPRGLLAATVGGAVGGAVAGACGGTTWVLVAVCGAAGGAVGTVATDLINGQGFDLSRVVAGTLGGALGGIAGKAFFPMSGRPPFKISNLWDPGINASQMYRSAFVGGLIGFFSNELGAAHAQAEGGICY